MVDALGVAGSEGAGGRDWEALGSGGGEEEAVEEAEGDIEGRGEALEDSEALAEEVGVAVAQEVEEAVGEGSLGVPLALGVALLPPTAPVAVAAGALGVPVLVPAAAAAASPPPLPPLQLGEKERDGVAKALPVAASAPVGELAAFAVSRAVNVLL